MKGSGMFVLVLAGCGLMLASAVEAAPGYELGITNQRDFRSRRGFKTVGLATARGFGKRTVLPPFSTVSSQASQSYTNDAGEQRQEQSPTDDHSGNDDLETYAPFLYDSFIARDARSLDIYVAPASSLCSRANHLFYTSPSPVPQAQLSRSLDTLFAEGLIFNPNYYTIR